MKTRYCGAASSFNPTGWASPTRDFPGFRLAPLGQVLYYSRRHSEAGVQRNTSYRQDWSAAMLRQLKAVPKS